MRRADRPTPRMPADIDPRRSTGAPQPVDRMTQSTELLPCPFCGSNAIVIGGDGNIAHARCGFCYSQGPNKQNRAEAIAAWNTRTTPDRNAVLREAAKVAKDHAKSWLEAGVGSCVAALVEEGETIAVAIEALTTTPEPTDPAGVSGVAEELAEWIYKARAEVATFERSSRATTVQLIAVADRALAALRPSPVLEVAKEALEDARLALGDVRHDAAVRVQTARDLIDAALATIKEGEAP